MWRTGIVALALAGCSQIFGLDVPTVSGSPPDDAPAGTVKIGGTVSGLGGASGLSLQDNGGDDKPILSDGAFVMPTAIAIGDGYAVTVSVEPTNPSELCMVGSGSGIARMDVNDIAVTCAAAAYAIGGNVIGLTGSVMLHNGSDTITVTSDGAFMFPTKVQSGQGYTVTATGNASCFVFGATGTVGDGDVTTVVVNCASAGGPYVIGGMISGLDGTLRLQNTDNADSITLTSNGTYAFPTPIPSAGAYNVTVLTQPLYPPARQTCSVANGSGNANGNVQNINITCATASFTVGGNLSGLSGTVVLQDNGADNLSRTTNGGFTFATPVFSGSSYLVTVATQPATQTCTVTNGTGTVGNGNVTNVDAICADSDTGVKCGTNTCTGLQGCCDPMGNKTCRDSPQCSSLFVPCDDAHDCNGAFCCAVPNAAKTAINSISCAATCDNAKVILCDPAVIGACTGGKSCQPYSLLTGYYACQ